MFCFWCSLSSYAFLRLSYDVLMRVYAFLVFWMRSFCFLGFHRFLTLSYACQMIFWLVSMCFLLFFPDVCLMFFCWFSSLPYAFLLCSYDCLSLSAFFCLISLRCPYGFSNDCLMVLLPCLMFCLCFLCVVFMCVLLCVWCVSMVVLVFLMVPFPFLYAFYYVVSCARLWLCSVVIMMSWCVHYAFLMTALCCSFVFFIFLCLLRLRPSMIVMVRMVIIWWWVWWSIAHAME